MVRRLGVVSLVVGVILAGAGHAAAATAGQTAAPGSKAQTSPAPPTRAVLDKYCVTCHSERLKTGGLTLQKVNVDDIPVGAELWERVVRKLRTGSMPPAGAPRPDAATLGAIATWLEDEIDRDAIARPRPGRTEALHRLNRSEYQNAVRDVLALDVDAAALVPADDQSYGFDNIAGVLKMSPTLLERYMEASRTISRLAVGAAVPPTAETFRVKSDLSQYEHLADLPFGTRGGMAFEYHFPRDGEYSFKVDMLDLFSGAQLKEPHQLEIAIDGQRVHVFRLVPKDSKEEAAYSTTASLETRASVKAGPHHVTATFIKKTNALAESTREPFARPHGEGDFLLYQPHIGTVTVAGPFSASAVGDTPSRRRIFTCRPTSVADEDVCARKIISTLARRAYRRPVADADVQPLLTFYREAKTGRGFDGGIERAIQALLVSPSFLYRVERESASASSSGVYRVSTIELASRLSFFLWSSIPDDELLTVATQGRLSDPTVLAAQVRRMLKDPKSAALASNFAAQWLRLRNLEGATPDDVIFPNFTDNLRTEFVKETELFFQSIVQEDRGVVELLTADYTFLTERLAKFYDVPHVYGSGFRRVRLTDERRRGLLGQGSILTVTSYGDRTSPVGRGKWVLENVLGTPPPPPPPNVPALQENGTNGKLLSMRERMSAHRANPVCASCHSRMDPLGFALENFDATGRWRLRGDDGRTVDASGAMPDGTKFDGPVELRAQLVKNAEQFVTVVAEKLLTYGLGRGVEYYDASSVRRVVRGAAQSKYRFSDVIIGLVTSTPFQMRAVPEAKVQAIAN
ncbi:MAG: DUF1592 domain-containing protein [Acidimicrobiia bacterium]|nr:DUF1592 domain-containing protein [Acidimicrobiia bacterium]